MTDEKTIALRTLKAVPDDPPYLSASAEDRNARLLRGWTMIVAAAPVPTYWFFVFLFPSAVRLRADTWYLIFERAFVLPDAIMATCLLVGGIAWLRASTLAHTLAASDAAGEQSIRTTLPTKDSSSSATYKLLPLYDHALISAETSYALPSDPMTMGGNDFGVYAFDNDPWWTQNGWKRPDIISAVSDHRPIWFKTTFEAKDRD